MVGSDLVLYLVTISALATFCLAGTSCMYEDMPCSCSWGEKIKTTDRPPEEMAVEHLQKLAYANNDLALKLYQRITFGSSRNVIFSPFSLSCVMGMLFYGARGKTAQELRSMLRYSSLELPDDLVHHTFHRFLSEVLPSTANSSHNVLSAANALFVDRSIDLLPAYRDAVQQLYQVSVNEVDFQGNAQAIVKEVNDWTRDRTRGKIKKLVDELSPDTAMMFMNAVYFKGTWKMQFAKQKTDEDIFYNAGSRADVVKVPMMHTKGNFRYSASFGCQALELPYQGGNLSMVILLPDKPKGLPHLEKSLTLPKLMELYDLLYDTKVLLALPKFKVRFGTDLARQYSDVGAGDLFRPGAADLSGMSDTDKSRVFVSGLVHKAAIEVNEEGSEAVAITSVLTMRMQTDRVTVFRADHPFLFFIIEQGSGSEMILFMGRVNKL